MSNDVEVAPRASARRSPPEPSGWRHRALAQLTLVRIREFTREPEAVFWALLFPILLAAGLGIAFRNRPPEALAIAASPELVRALAQEPQLAVRPLSREEGVRQLTIGDVALFAEPGPGGTVLYHYDLTNPEGRTARMLADAAVQRAAGRMDPVGVDDRLVEEAGARYIDFLIPGLVGMGIMGNSIWGLGFSIVDARRRKLMKRIVATPMPRHLYLLSFLLFRMMLLGVEVGVPVIFGIVAFGVPFRGAALTLVSLAVLGSLTFSALGLLIASRAKTIEGVSGLMNLVMLPMWILSGVFFSAQRFPDAVQPLIEALPLTALIDGLRATMLQGAGPEALWREAGTLGAWLVVCFGAALKLFRWR